MDKDLVTWATGNPLAAIALFGTIAGALTGFIIALGRAAPHIAQAIKTWRQRRNGNGNGDRAAGEEFLSLAAFDATISGIHRRIAEVSTEGRDLGERMAVVEETCKRTEIEVKALPGTVRSMLEAQTVQLQESNRRHILAAFTALDKQTDEKIATAIKARA